MSYVPLVVLLFAIIGACRAECPHEEAGLAKFSETYTGNYENTEVDITSSVLLDVADVSFKRLIISGDGKLVFGRGIDITLRAKAILVKGNGQFIIGSEDCRHTDIVNIILQGKKGEFPELKGHGGEEKYLIVEDQGVLKIHGADKLAWTKIDATLDRWEAFINDTSMVKYNHKTSDNAKIRSGKKGLAVYTVNVDHTIASYSVVDLFNRNRVHKEQEEVDALVTALNDVSAGQLVSIAIQNYFDPAPETSLTALYDTIEDVAGMQRDALLLRDAGKFTAFTLMFIKAVLGKSYRRLLSVVRANMKDPTYSGQYQQSLEDVSAAGLSTARVSLDLGDYKVTSISHIDKASTFRSGIELRILHKSIGYPTATTVHDISSWNVGDEVILTSTDYAAHHTEVRKILQAIPPNKVVLSEELMYRHFGEIENRVDMRAEIALLTRNIKIQGEVQDGCPAENGNCDKVDFDSFGGHVKMVHSFGKVHIQGVEFKHMGQLGVKGVYPIHFHMCKDISGKIAILEDNSIHHTFQRAITIHCTWGTSVEQPGVMIKHNVAYHVYGHTFFLEDGAESATIFIGNLGALTMNIETGFFATDATEATTFWITNPKVVLIGNVAAGSSGGSGIWYVFPLEPVGPSTGLVYEKDEALQTAIWACDHNTVHSNHKVATANSIDQDERAPIGALSSWSTLFAIQNISGFQMAKLLLDGDGNVGSHFKYVPLTKAMITMLTAYKNRMRNAWIRGGAQFSHYSSAESDLGIAMARAEYHPGIELIYGPQYYSQVWFTGYQSYSDDSYAAGGIGFKRKATFPISELTSFRNFRFGFKDPVEGNRVYNLGPSDANIGHVNLDGNEIQSFRDVDGSVYACDQLPANGSKQFVKPEKYLLTDNCKYRDNWQMAVCDDLYGSAKVDIKNVWTGIKDDYNRTLIAKRVKYSDSSDTAYENHMAMTSTPRTLMVLGNQAYYYEVEFVNQFPKDMTIEIDGVERDNNVVVGVCLPEGAVLNTNFEMKGFSGSNRIQTSEFKLGASLSEVGADPSMQTIYTEGRILYLHFASGSQRDLVYDTARCFGDVCPRYDIVMSEQLAYTPCFNPTSEELSTDFMPELVPKLTCEYPSGTYGADWGVGDTFASRDGTWSEWSAWTSCESSSRTRTRLCDSPPPYGDGAGCGDVTSETESC